MNSKIFLLFFFIASTSAFSFSGLRDAVRRAVVVVIERNPIVRAVKATIKGVQEQKPIAEILTDTAAEVVAPVRRATIALKALGEGNVKDAVVNVYLDKHPNLKIAKGLIEGALNGNATEGVINAASEKATGSTLGHILLEEIKYQKSQNSQK